MCVGSSEQEIFLLSETQQILEEFHQLWKLEQLQPEGRKGKPMMVIANMIMHWNDDYDISFISYINSYILYLLPNNQC